MRRLSQRGDQPQKNEHSLLTILGVAAFATNLAQLNNRVYIHDALSQHMSWEFPIDSLGLKLLQDSTRQLNFDPIRSASREVL